ncbi:MAG: response regulator, partial [Planctomycetota bacterium]|nr:response regulator [Planctomycetota bacterium]
MHTRILLFEDSDLDAGVIEAAIQDNSDSYTLERVYRLEDGLRSLSEQDCDCILLDLNLPDSKGLGTLRHIRAETLDPIIVLTLGTDVEMAMDALKNGAQDFIPKEELKPSLLLRTLSYTLQRRQAQQKLEETLAALEAARADAIQKAEELEEEKEILEAVINNLVEGVLVADEDGDIVHINSTARRLQNIGESDGKMEESVGLLDPETHSALDEENLPFARALRGD